MKKPNLSAEKMVVTKVTVRDWTNVGGTINKGRGTIGSTRHSQTEIWLLEPTSGREERAVANDIEIPVREGQTIRLVYGETTYVAMKNLATGQRIQMTSTADLLTPALSFGRAMSYTCAAWVAIVVALFLAICFLNVTRFGFGDTFWVYPVGFMAWLIGGHNDRLRFKKELEETSAEIARLLE